MAVITFQEYERNKNIEKWTEKMVCIFAHLFCRRWAYFELESGVCLVLLLLFDLRIERIDCVAGLTSGPVQFFLLFRCFGYLIQMLGILLVAQVQFLLQNGHFGFEKSRMWPQMGRRSRRNEYDEWTGTLTHTHTMHIVSISLFKYCHGTMRGPSAIRVFACALRSDALGNKNSNTAKWDVRLKKRQQQQQTRRHRNHWQFT